MVQHGRLWRSPDLSNQTEQLAWAVVTSSKTRDEAGAPHARLVLHAAGERRMTERATWLKVSAALVFYSAAMAGRRA